MALKVFDLQCEHGHVFEGWFASQEDYDAQQQRGLIACPLCHSTTIIKRLSAPRLNMGRHMERNTDTQQTPQTQATPAETDSPVQTPPSPAMTPQHMAMLMQKMRDIVRQTENVGVQFAQEARRIHEGEAEQRPIRGVATLEERDALAADGIAVTPIPAVFDDERLQ